MAQIAVLDSLTADQIAAGEVVERPASVVKELVENSLDAGATRVRLDIEAGGVARIRVLDNGTGIAPEQVALAFERHATSKMARLEDLDTVATHGFRGEALPSIASVSKISLRTRIQDHVAGQLLRLEGGKIVEQREEGCPVGTDIEVKDLFFNTPARLKFLKRETTEAGHASEALVRLAIWRPDVAFSMTSSGRRSRELPKVERVEERVAGLFGGETLIRAQGTESGVDVLAVLGPPERARPGAGSLYTYVNGRFIRDKALLKAVTQAFGGTLERGRYPVGMIGLAVPAGSYDVNVHPQKTEIRFVDPGAIFNAVARVVGEMVRAPSWALGAPGPAKVAEGAEAASAGDTTYRSSARLVPPPPDPGRDLSTPVRTTPATGTEAPIQPGLPHGAHVDGEPIGRFSDLRYIGQAKGLFLLFESGEELVIIDQHAAHERITFEKLRDQLNRGGIAAQKLLLPHTVELGPEDTERIASLIGKLDRLGLEVSRSGPDRIAVHALPAELAGASPDRLLADMVMALEEGRVDSRGELDDKILATMACHGSLRSGQTVEKPEVDALLTQMETVDFAGHCPHGRPVLARIPWHEIRRRVGRT
jgi:DNA mismatch repair protein MutL